MSHLGFRPWAGRPAPAGGHCTWLQLNFCDVKSSPGKHWSNIWSGGDDARTGLDLLWLWDAGVRSSNAYQHPPLAHERRKRGVIQFASGPCNGLCYCLICLLPSSCFPTLPTIVIPLCWGDTQSAFCSAKCLVRPGKWGTFNGNQPAHTAPSSLFLPACLPGTRRVTAGVWTGPQKPSAGDKVALTSAGQWAAGDQGDAGEGSAPVSPRVHGGAVSKDRRLHLASWLAQQFLQEV